MKQRIWFERRFALGTPATAFPEILERIRGTPARLEDRVADLSGARLTTQSPLGTWSIQENIGHLLDLEPLWAGRLDDLQDGRPVLREADLANRKTHEAGHNADSIGALLAAFREARTSVVRRLEALPDVALTRTADHPRLNQPMTAVDLFFFVAEHDDHHLAAITGLLGSLHP